MSTQERLLVLLLRVSAVVLLSALVAAFMPFDWMAWTHRALGLGELAGTPLTQYLTRSLSGLYAFHGAVLLFLSFDVRRYRPVVRFLGVGNLVFGVFLLGLDLSAGMPSWWALGEGPLVAAFGLLLLWLARPSDSV
jgi:hypothetical protein